MNANELKEIVQLIIKSQEQTQGWSLTEIIMAITATLGCLVTTYIFIRSVINNGFELIKLQNQTQNITLEKQEVTLNRINETLMNYKIDTVKHNTCAERQQKLIERVNVGIDNLESRIKRLEDKEDGKKHE
jgi:hypothetical protein